MNGLHRQVRAISSTHWIKRRTELLASKRRCIPSCCQREPPKPVARGLKITGCQHVKDLILRNNFFFFAKHCHGNAAVESIFQPQSYRSQGLDLSYCFLIRVYSCS